MGVFRRARLLAAVSFLGGSSLLGAACCSPNETARPDHILVIRASPEALLGDGTSIVRAEILGNRLLAWSSAAGDITCGSVEEARIVSRLRGTGHEEFLADEPLETGQHYLLAILDLEGKMPPTTESSVGERDKALLECRKQLPRYVLGWARFVSPDSDRVLIESSTIIPDSVRASAVDGSVSLEAIRKFFGQGTAE